LKVFSYTQVKSRPKDHIFIIVRVLLGLGILAVLGSIVSNLASYPAFQIGNESRIYEVLDIRMFLVIGFPVDLIEMVDDITAKDELVAIQSLEELPENAVGKSDSSR
jgi:hypothetical protein